MCPCIRCNGIAQNLQNMVQSNERYAREVLRVIRRVRVGYCRKGKIENWKEKMELQKGKGLYVLA